nr:unnamed protein product [Callosobruchus analis]
MSIHHTLLMTMVDGKVCNSLTQNCSSQTCYICGATPKQMNIQSENEKYVTGTKDLYLNLYPWYYMPVTVHKLFTHSTKIITNCMVPIGQLSEEVQEARNKDSRRFRLSSTIMTRLLTNRDLLTMLSITSDPIINSFREVPQKSSKTGLVHKVITRQEPEYLVSKLKLRVNIRHGNQLSIPKLRSAACERSFSYNSVNIYNSVPPEIKRQSTMFKKHLKTYLKCFSQSTEYFEEENDFIGVLIWQDIDKICIRRKCKNGHCLFSCVQKRFICDSDLNILNLDATFGGATHDAYICTIVVLDIMANRSIT